MRSSGMMKRIILVLTVLAMLMQSLMITGIAATTDTTVNYDAKILQVKGGANAIATLTFDDGVHSTAELLRNELVEYDLKASLMVVPSRVQALPPYTSGYSDVEQLRAMAEGGYVDIQSHSYSHLYMHNDGDNVVNNTEENRMNEIPGSRDWLAERFPTQDIITMAVPGGKYSTEAETLMMNTYYAARYSNSGASLSNIQTLLPEDSIEPGGWYRLNNLWLTEAGVTGGSIGAYLDACVAQGGWFITGCHNITTDPSKIGSGNNDITLDTLKAFFEQLKEHQDSGKLWVTTFSDATKYLREYQNSTVKQYSNSQGMFVELTMAESTARGMALDADTFDMPLTVRVEIPDGWTNVRFMQNAKETVVPTFTDGSKTYAYAEIVPNGGTVSVTNGDEELVKDVVNSELTLAKGGAKAVASMTFDDGLYPTATLLNELCREYGLKASLMMITDRINAFGYTSTSQWNSLFADGYLAPDSHSATHMNVKDHNQTDDELEVEIGGSLTTLKKHFPTFDTLTFAVPNSNYTEKEYKFVSKYFYAARGGRCVLAPAYGNVGNMMTLDPEMGYGINSWYNPSMVRLQSNIPAYADTNSTENILKYLQKCISNNGWFISITHGVNEGNPADMTEAQMREIFASMKYYQDKGDLWVATYTEATKYIRERQNSTVSAYKLFDNIYVDLTMTDTTEDGLPLNPEIFNMPLTVKVELPDNWGRFTYKQADGVEKVAYAFTENGVKFAYIDLVPNGGSAILSNEGDPTGYVETLGMKQNVSAEESLTYNIYIPTDSLVSAVYSGKKELSAVKMDNGYTKYSVGDINVVDVNKEFNFSLKFHDSTGYSDYTFTKSVVSYLADLADSATATANDKQLAYDFAVFARATVNKFNYTAAGLIGLDAVIKSLEDLGYTASSTDEAPADLGTVDNVLCGAAFAINEKPYYVFYINEGFTGKITFTIGDKSTEFDVVNGYYHCKHYLIYEVESVYDLASKVSIKAEVVKNAETGEAEVVAEGAYSIVNYLDGLTEGGVAPEYESALYSYAVSAAKYNAALAEDSAS